MAKTLEIKPAGDIVTHINEQTFGANASTAIAEAIPNPGYSEAVSVDDDFRTGLLLHEVQVLNAAGVVAHIEPGANGLYCVQVQSGNREGTPAVVQPDSPYLIAHTQLCYDCANTEADVLFRWPLDVEFFRRVPIVVMPHLTVCHLGTNAGGLNSKVLYTKLEWQVVHIPVGLFSILFQNQARTS